jgi:hypothetical protein
LTRIITTVNVIFKIRNTKTITLFIRLNFYFDGTSTSTRNINADWRLIKFF